MIPYYIDDNELLYYLFKRANLGVWQFISGGVENTEKPIEAAKREVREEIGLDNCNIEKLEAHSTIPAVHFKQYQTDLDCDTFLVEELTFAIQTNNKNVIRLCDEHTKFMWMSYQDAIKLLEWDSNKTAFGNLIQNLS